MSAPTHAVVPAQVFHAAEYLADECLARGWSLRELAERIGSLDTPMEVVTWQFYACCQPDIFMGEDSAWDLQRVLGISATFWLRIEAAYRGATPEQRAPLSEEATAFYGLTDEVSR